MADRELEATLDWLIIENLPEEVTLSLESEWQEGISDAEMLEEKIVTGKSNS